MNRAYISIGSNQGNRREQMERAIAFLMVLGGAIVKRSDYFETKAWGKEDQPDFLNMCLELTTTKSAHKLLKVIQDIETQLDRQRTQKWGQRTVDLDILFFNDAIINDDQLTVPHPYIPQRKFVLVPLAQVAAGVVHPVLHKTVQQLLESCPDDLEVVKVG